MNTILKPMIIKKNIYEEMFNSLSIENIKTYMINHGSTLTYMSKGKVDDYVCIEELLVRHHKAEMMRIYTWKTTETVLYAKQDTVIGFNRNEKYIETIERRKKKYYVEKYFPLTLEEVSKEFNDLEYRFVGEIQKSTLDDLWFDIQKDLGEINLKTLGLQLNNIEETYFYFGDDSYIFTTKNKEIYKVYSEGGTGLGEGLVCYLDTNLKTFGNKRFNFYFTELEEFLPNLHKDKKYLKYLNHFLFDQEKRNIIVLTEKESEYKGIKNSLYQLAESELQLSNEIYKSIFKMPIEFEQKSLNRRNSFNTELMQVVETNYEISYNYGAILVEKVMYVIFWDNY